MSEESNGRRYPIAIIRDRAFLFARADLEFDEAGWERAWAEYVNRRRPTVEILGLVEAESTGSECNADQVPPPRPAA